MCRTKFPNENTPTQRCCQRQITELMVYQRGGTLRCSRGMNTWNEDQAQAAVKVQAALGAEIVCSGHGPIVREATDKFPIQTEPGAA